MAKRKSDAADKSASASERTAKAQKTAATTTTSKSADKLGLSYDDFAKTAPELSLILSNKSSKNDKKAPLPEVDLKKTHMKTGSFGYTGNGKKITVEVEIDGKKEMVQAQVSLNITVLGSKKVSQEDEKGDDSSEN